MDCRPSSPRPSLSRETRSGKSFASWNGPYAQTSAPDFDFESLLKASVALEESAAAQPHLFSLSPLSSPEPSPSTSPCATPAQSPRLAPSSLPTAIPTATISERDLPSQSQLQSNRKRRQKDQSKKNRKQQREAKRREVFALPPARDAVVQKYVNDCAEIKTPVDTKNIRVTKTSYVGLNDKEIRSRKAYRLDELVGSDSKFNFELVEWDGVTVWAILGANNELLAILAGHPGTEEDWAEVHEEACGAIEEAAKLRPEGSKTTKEHRRGRFDTLLCGISHGGGQLKPGNLVQKNAVDRQLAERLNSLKAFQRIAGFATSVVASWTPKLYDYYVDILGKLHARYPELKRNFTSSIFAASTYNLGPQTVCFRHTDFANLPFGWCAVTALGSFDHIRGGHLVLWECGLVTRFPPGATILLLSGVISHSNVPVAPSEVRYSFTQYTAGGLFRWVENGFQKTTEYRASLSDSQRRELDERSTKRWKFGLSLLSRVKISTSSV